MCYLFICDHHLDPRLTRRKNWLERKYGKCIIYVDKSRGIHFKNNDNEEHDLKELSFFNVYKHKYIYVSGAKVVITHFFYLLFARFLNKELVYEIPDLPLRLDSKLKNEIISSIFKLIVKVLFKRVVITSSAFKKRLPKKVDYYECENLPSLMEFDNSNAKKTKEKSVSFVGVIRYMKQMKMLIRYASIRNINVNFFGGPQENIDELIEYNNSLTEKGRVNFYGVFSQNELVDIYSKTSFVYSVYDSSQENVRLALPNKLYESILFQTPIIVSKSTYLGEIVSEENSGFQVESQNFVDFCLDMDEGLEKNYTFNSEKVRDKIANQEKRFMDWLDRVQEI